MKTKKELEKDIETLKKSLEEKRLNISNVLKGYKKTKEHRNNLSKSAIGNINGRGNKKIYFEFLQLPTIEDVHKEILNDEGKFTQSVCFSTFHNALTQINFTKKIIRSNIKCN